MTLIEHGVQQGTDEWLELRRGVVTASTVGKLITAGPPSALGVTCSTCGVLDGPCLSIGRKTPTPMKTVHDARTAAASDLPPVLSVADTQEARSAVSALVAERVTGWIEPTFITQHMWRGVEDEPRARDVYAEHCAPVRETGFYVEDRWGFQVGFSPDGVVGDDGLIEIKSRLAKIQLRTLVSDEVPVEVMPQLQTGLLVTGRKWIDYVSYCGGMPLYVKRVFPDRQWHDVIVAAVERFESDAARMVAAYEAAVIGRPTTERAIEMDMVL